MLGLSSIGLIHTAISLIALVAGIIALARDQKISPKNVVGRTYIIMTVLTCLTGFGIFRHGSFGAPHALGVLTLVVLGVAATAGRTRLFGRASPYVETVSYSLTFFFHLIPGFTETATRLPVGAPLASGPDEPLLKATIGVCFILFLLGAALQIRRLRRFPAR